MQRTLTTGVLAAALFAPAVSMAETNSNDIEAMRAELAAMRAELSQLKASPADVQANQDLKAATAALVQDAQNRINYEAEALSAGHDGKFFLESPEGDFRLNVEGALQFRYVANFRENTGSDDSLSGFTLRRTKLGFNGHVTRDKKFTYGLVLSAKSDTGTVSLEDFIIGYKLNDDNKVQIGQFKLPFAREELISSKRQLTVDRSIVTEFFTLDRSQGIQLTNTSIDNLKLAGMISDGADAENQEWNSTNSDIADIALTGRADYVVFGDAKAGKDVVAWDGTEDTLLVGAAAHLDIANSGDSTDDTYYAWTVDALYKTGGLSLLGAIHGLHTDGDDGRADFDDYGLLVGAGYSIDDNWQPFAQYNYIDIDDADEVSAIVVGVNYFLKKEKAKFTADAVIFLDPLSTPGRFPNNPGSGLGVADDAAGEDGQVAFRAQFQLVF